MHDIIHIILTKPQSEHRHEHTIHSELDILDREVLKKRKGEENRAEQRGPDFEEIGVDEVAGEVSVSDR